MKTLREIEKLHRHYNPECDLVKNGPIVTWADYALLQLIEDLYKRIDRLESRLREVENTVALLV